MERSMPEIWRPAVGYEGLYSVSNEGRIRSEDRRIKHRHGGGRKWVGKILSPTIPKVKTGLGRSYPAVTLWKNSIPRKFRIHELVAAAFVGTRPTGFEILHYDDDPTNNDVSNLRYGTHAENGADITRNRPACKWGHQFTTENTYIRRDTGTRQCRQCSRDRRLAKFKPDPRSPIQCDGKQ
jgi:hypothetical protein